jgi:DNA-binding transcriptional MerR regulator
MTKEPIKDPTAPQGMTVDELALHAGLPSSTVRLYQTKGLLPPPRREGRVGVYGTGHLARLRLIGQLQERGFSLAGIKHLIDTWESGRTLDDLLGLEAQAVAVTPRPQLLQLRVEELATRFADQPLTPEVLRRSMRLGLVAADDDGWVTCDAEFLDFGAQLAALGIRPDEILDEWEALLSSTTSSARRFVSLFKRHVWQPFVEAGMPADQIGALTDTLRRLTPLAQAVTAAALRLALQDVASAFVAEHARRLDPDGTLLRDLHQGPSQATQPPT